MDYYAYQGASYEGDLQNNEPHGRGVMRMPDGSVYEGEFVHGQFHGKGVLRFPAGRIEGVWDQGELGEHEIFFADQLQFKPEGWEYIRPSNRSFYSEATGAVPLAASRLTPTQYGSLEEIAGLREAVARVGAGEGAAETPASAAAEGSAPAEPGASSEAPDAHGEERGQPAP